MKRKTTPLVIAMICGCFTFSQTKIDDFNDNEFISNQTWSGNTLGFSVITDEILPNANASTDGFYLGSKSSQTQVSIGFSCNEVSEWRFSLGSTNFNPSNLNYIGVVLMSSTAFSGDMLSNDFKGYYLRIGDSEGDAIELWRKTGLGKVLIGEFPNSPNFSNGALQNGLNIRITRNSSGVFELFYREGFQFNSFPTISAGTLTSNNYSTSAYFGIYQNINDPSPDRRVFIDNIQLGVINWDGSDGNDWLSSENWDTNTIPTSTDNVIIPSNLNNYPTVSTAETINSLIINSGSTLVSNNASFSISSYAIYSRHLENGGQWYYLSSPVVGETYDNLWVSENSIASGQNNNRGISLYDNSEFDTDSDGAGSDTETGYWRYFQANDSGNFNLGQGYGIITSNPSTILFNGVGIYSSNQTRSITRDVSNFNLIGNPFTSYLNLGDFFTDNGDNVISGASAYFWNGSSYITRTSELHSSYEIAPGQGFFVEAAADSNITFDITDVTHQSSETFQKITKPQIKLFLSDGKNSRYITIYYIDDTTTGYDNGYDGKLFGGTSDSFALYSQLVSNSNGDLFQLQSLPNSNHQNMVIPIGAISENYKEVTFTSKSLNLPSNIKVYLEDRENNTFTQLDLEKSEYKTTLTESLNGIGRFYLHTKTNVLNTNEFPLENISIFKIDSNTLRITGLSINKYKLTLINLLGEKLMEKSFKSNGILDISLPNISRGIYIIELKTDKVKFNRKIILE